MFLLYIVTVSNEQDHNPQKFLDSVYKWALVDYYAIALGIVFAICKTDSLLSYHLSERQKMDVIK